MKVIAFIVNLFAPAVNFMGLLGICHSVISESFSVFIFAGLMAVAGFIFGLYAYKLDIPPRWTWSKSPNQLFSFSITAVLGYTYSFAAWPLTIYFIKSIAENVMLKMS